MISTIVGRFYIYYHGEYMKLVFTRSEIFMVLHFYLFIFMFWLIIGRNIYNIFANN